MRIKSRFKFKNEVGSFDKCFLCGQDFHLWKNENVANHLNHKHNGIRLIDYLNRFYTKLNEEEKCAFCDEYAQSIVEINHENKSFKFTYPKGFSCGTIECKDKICLKFFNKPYSECAHKYEHIGANVEYLMMKNKKSKKEIIYEKKIAKNFENYVRPDRAKTNIKGYFLRYGENLGLEKYLERNKKIAFSQTIEWHINKYGLEDGTRIFEEKRRKVILKIQNIIKSKCQYEIFNKLKDFDPCWESERYLGGAGIVDMANFKKRVALEYFGGYWHCDPYFYPPDYLNKTLNMKAKEKNEKDKNKIKKMLKDKRIDKLIIVWESDYVNDKENCFNEIIKAINEKTEKKKCIIIKREEENFYED